MYRIVIAPDKFKGSLDSFAVCANIEKGLRSALDDFGLASTDFGSASADFEIIQLPLADGGDGLLDVIAHYTDARVHRAVVNGPLFKPVSADWLLSADGRTAYIEMAKASGLQLLKPSEYNSMLSSTYGTGELIKHAIHAGAEEIVIGIGGSATNDGGIGMAAALGYRFLDADGQELTPIGANLVRLARIEAPQSSGERGLGPYLREKLGFRVACDVSNPLCGPSGATRVYAPQKGADPVMVEQLEAGMLHYAEILQRDMGTDIARREGAGAAGGLGAGCMAFLQAGLVKGTDLVIEYSKAAEQIQAADLVITGEGKLDRQTGEGKLVAGIAALGRRYQKPVIAICGTLDLSPAEWRRMGIAAAFSIVNRPMSLEEACANAAPLLEGAAYGLGCLLKTGKR
jgi:glycerate 2-kinase